MRQNLLLLLLLTFSIYSSAQDDTTHHPDGPKPGAIKTTPENSEEVDKSKTSDINSILSPILSYNFSGGNTSLGGLTPVINYGWSKEFKLKKHANKFTLAVNPYSAGQIKIKDSANYVPALMLPGIAGLNINTILTFGGDEAQFILSPINFGLKLNTNFKDSDNVIMQHNIRTAIGFRYTDYFQMSVQFTMGWHNLTTQSAENFKKLFKRETTDINYVTVILQTLLNNTQGKTTGKDVTTKNILFLEWRCLTNKGFYSGFPNNQILTIGFRKDFDITSLVPAAGHRVQH